MTSEERTRVLEIARQLCLEVAAEEHEAMKRARRAGDNSPGFNQALGGAATAEHIADLVTDLIEEEKHNV